MASQEEKEFKDIVSALLCSLGKRSTERELRKVYREQEGQNINNVLEKLFGPTYTLYQFLRFKCNDICDTFRLDGEVKIERFLSESTKHIQKMSKSKKRGNNKRPAPKLNYPKNHLRVRSSHNNPQGFSRRRSAIAGDPFADVDKHNDLQNNIPVDHKITLGNFLNDSIDNNFLEPPPSTQEAAAAISTVFNQSNEMKLDNLLKVQNSFEFPQLKRNVTKSTVQNESTNDNNVCSYRELISKLSNENVMNEKLYLPNTINTYIEENDSEDEEISSNELELDEEQNNVQQEHKEEKQNKKEERYIRTLSSIVSSNDDDFNGLDVFEFANSQNKKTNVTILPFNDKLFLMDYPDVVKGTSKKIRKANIKKLDHKHQFPIFITTIYSPTQFYFQYDEEGLNELMANIQEFYKSIPENSLIIELSDLVVGQIVAAKMDGVWNRSEVLSIKENGRIELLFLDFGVFLTRPITFIRYIPESFTLVPAKALRGSLYGIQSDRPSDQWSDDSRNFFFIKIKDKELHASIRAVDKDGFYYLDIFETLLSKQSITEEMIENLYGKQKIVEDILPYAAILSY
ncbi:hypothetical protein PVAND_010307 [Polypedilum vanderplanki]|uniref:Tudor domain-containing protein n=1 Tax=Polypedilum vanderplanki TaxID=319348 RepID=A0A9J6CG91_POLVA|nr:hypothetical protein PVAND_010307 [Polypedilum vanderplanki]